MSSDCALHKCPPRSSLSPPFPMLGVLREAAAAGAPGGWEQPGADESQLQPPCSGRAREY